MHEIAKGVCSSVVKWLLSMHEGPEFKPKTEREEGREMYRGRRNKSNLHRE